jgi:hypothetical protein
MNKLKKGNNHLFMLASLMAMSRRNIHHPHFLAKLALGDFTPFMCATLYAPEAAGNALGHPRVTIPGNYQILD